MSPQTLERTNGNCTSKISTNLHTSIKESNTGKNNTSNSIRDVANSTPSDVNTSQSSSNNTTANTSTAIKDSQASKSSSQLISSQSSSKVSSEASSRSVTQSSSQSSVSSNHSFGRKKQAASILEDDSLSTTATVGSRRHSWNVLDSLLPVHHRGLFFHDSFFQDAQQNFQVAVKDVLDKFGTPLEPSHNDHLSLYRTLRGCDLGDESQAVKVTETLHSHQVRGQHLAQSWLT